MQRVELVQETIDREIRPQLKRDGGDIELVDFNALLLESTQETKVKTTRRSRRGRKKSVSTETQQAPAQEETSGSEKVAGTQAAETQKTEEAETAVEETVMEEPVDTGETGKVEQASAEEESSGEAVKKEEKQETKAEKTPEETKSEDKEEDRGDRRTPEERGGPQETRAHEAQDGTSLHVEGEVIFHENGENQGEEQKRDQQEVEEVDIHR